MVVCLESGHFREGAVDFEDGFVVVAHDSVEAMAQIGIDGIDGTGFDQLQEYSLGVEVGNHPRTGAVLVPSGDANSHGAIVIDENLLDGAIARNCPPPRFYQFHQRIGQGSGSPLGSGHTGVVAHRHHHQSHGHPFLRRRRANFGSKPR